MKKNASENNVPDRQEDWDAAELACSHLHALKSCLQKIILRAKYLFTFFPEAKIQLMGYTANVPRSKRIEELFKKKKKRQRLWSTIKLRCHRTSMPVVTSLSPVKDASGESSDKH